MFERQELWEIRTKAVEESLVKGLNTQWKRCYENLADAVDYLDAMIARTEDKNIKEIEDIEKK